MSGWLDLGGGIDWLLATRPSVRGAMRRLATLPDAAVDDLVPQRHLAPRLRLTARAEPLKAPVRREEAR